MEQTKEPRSRCDEAMRGMFFGRWNNGTFVTVAYELSSVTAGDATLRMACMRSLPENRHQIVVWVGSCNETAKPVTSHIDCLLCDNRGEMFAKQNNKVIVNNILFRLRARGQFQNPVGYTFARRELQAYFSTPTEMRK